MKLNSLDLQYFHELADTMKYGCYIHVALFLPSSHSKQFAVTSPCFTEYYYAVYCLVDMRLTRCAVTHVQKQKASPPPPAKGALIK